MLAGIIDRPENSSAANSPANLPVDHRPSGEVENWPVVVFSHCFTCNKDLKSTVRIARALADRGIAVLRFDMTGLGGSQGDFSQSNFSTNLADLSAAIRFATDELGPVGGLLGHSFGGAASLAIASQASSDGLQPIRAVVSLAAPSDTTHLADLLSSMNPAIQREGFGKVTIGGLEWTIRREMLDDFRNHDLPKRISEINCPVLLLHSPVDKTVRFDHALRIMSLINSSSSLEASVSLASLSEADHLLAGNPADIQYVASLASAFFRRFCA
ncbi:Alpha/beta hydrolase family protein [Planctomycetes bacterium K23_9]|uniref:Alpha/beta hydrolase family protein n=2 Tax=Stieleria marina TaxID=1930275 RepID=A0A517NQ48_9BACT|nr:Alpha/beta hydrolase family protein [Planctomycetes bacterium K23_9]